MPRPIRADWGCLPVYFLDANLPTNDVELCQLTGHLYGGDDQYRLSQEAILGIGGIRILQVLNHRKIEQFHMNEGHAALLTLESLREQREQANRIAITQDDLLRVRKKCVFTTHAT